jgi:Pyruvate/2-oxoacid:ferredoxin oxidoreductase delta subunit
MNEVSIIVNGMRFDAVNEEDYHSCKGCDIGKNASTADCLLSALCRRRNIIFKKSNKSFER